MKPFLLILLFGCAPLARAQETGKPVDFDNPRVGDYLALELIIFDYDGIIQNRQDCYQIIQDALASLKRLPNWKFRLESHRDCRASHTFNDTLTQARADTLLNYVLAMGFPAWRITAKGMGERMLLMEKCSCDLTDYNSRICPEKEHQLNRRIVIRLTEKIEWTGHEPLSLKFPSAGQFRAIAFENSDEEAHKSAYAKLWSFLDSLDQCNDLYFTLYYLPGKRSLNRRFEGQKKKKSTANLKITVNVPSRMKIVIKRPGQAIKGVHNGYVLVIDSLVQKKKIMDEILISADTNILIFDVNYYYTKPTDWQTISIGGLPKHSEEEDKYRLLIVTTDDPEKFTFFDLPDYKKRIACQDTSGYENFLAFSEWMREEFPNFPEIVEVRYINIPELKRPWMLILQPIREEE